VVERPWRSTSWIAIIGDRRTSIETLLATQIELV
jgi:hypothetical protein